MDPETVRLLEKFNQSQLLRFCDELSPEEESALGTQLQGIDFEELDSLIENALSKEEQESLSPSEISPLSHSIRLPESDEERAEWEKAREAGEILLGGGKVGAILVAGGQGSRLGFDHPKGMFPIGPVTGRTLFQIFFEQLLALSNRYGVRIPYFIMTSDATHEETYQFLEKHSWFGYPPEDVFLFKQGTMPAVDDQNGKILLKDKHEIAMSPDGHGGLLNALHKAGLFEEMEKRGIETLYYHQVDNPCVQICDPAMIGFHNLQEAEISTKVVAKREPAEKVGVLAEANGKQSIIEYSDLSDEMAEDVDESGRLKYWAGNIAIHVMNRSLLQRLATGDTRLPVHIAHKKVACLDEKGESVNPQEPNAFKFERFIFDAIPLSHRPLVIETSREDEFNPVKNAEGLDSPATAKEALNKRSHRWLREAGFSCEQDAVVEISPLIAMSPDDLDGQVTQDQFEGKEIVLSPES